MSKNFCKIENKWCKFCSAHRKYCRFKAKENVLLKNICKCPKRESEETCSFKELLFNVSFEDIMTEMFKYWPEEEKNYFGYRKVYTTLLTLKGKRNDMFIHASIRTEKDLLDDTIEYTYVDVYADKKNDEYHYGIDVTNWREIVAMNISKETLATLTPAQIACGIFYEITFNGYSMEEVNEFRAELYERAEEAKKLIEESKNSRS